MNIIYGVSGEGLGHASHAMEIASILEKNGHRVIILTYGDAYEVLKNKFKVVDIYGVNFIYENGKLKYSRSFFSLFKFGKNLLHMRKLNRLMKTFKPQLCITDMEPVTSLVSYIHKITLISLSNQNRFTAFKIDLPKGFEKDFIVAKSMINLVVPSADWYIALSFSKLSKIVPNAFLSSPIIKEDIRNLKTKEGDFILVYLSKENDPVLDVLRNVDEKFVVYGYNLKKTEGNLEFRKRGTFLEDFANCKAIISASGFTSVVEAIYLKKPYLAIPLKGHFEQEYNALLLKQKKLGEYSDELTKKQVDEFIEKIPMYKRNLKKYKITAKAPASILLDIIKKLEKKNDF